MGQYLVAIFDQHASVVEYQKENEKSFRVYGANQYSSGSSVSKKKIYKKFTSMTKAKLYVKVINKRLDKIKEEPGYRELLAEQKRIAAEVSKKRNELYKDYIENSYELTEYFI